MDNLTHSLFGLTLARTPLGRAGRGTTAALLLASNAPDIDIVTTSGGAVTYLKWHRGPTHGPLGVLGLAVVIAGLIQLTRRINPKWRHEAEDASFGMLVAVGLVGGVGHVLMDLPTAYGIRLLSPFDWHWYALDWMPIVSVYLLVVLAAGLFFGRAPDARRRNAAIVLTLMAAIYAVHGVAHQRAMALAPRLFGPTLPQPCATAPESIALVESWPRAAPLAPPPGRRCVVEIAAIPTFGAPVSWRIVAQMSNAFELHDVDILDSRLREPASNKEVFWRQVVRYPNVWTPTVEKAAVSDVGRVFLGFSRFPAARSAVDPSGTTTVRISDVRFVAGPTGVEQALQRSSIFTATVEVNEQGQVIAEALGPPSSTTARRR